MVKAAKKVKVEKKDDGSNGVDAEKKGKKKEKKEEKSPEELREEKIVLIRKEINKEFGKGTTRPASQSRVDLPRLPIGIFALDFATGGGFPVGRVSMAKGESKAFKTSMMLRVIGNAQRMCSSCWRWREQCVCGKKRKTYCLWLDQEGVFDFKWAQLMGVNLEDLELQQPVTAEESIDVVNRWFRGGVIDVGVIDSVAAMTPMDEINASSEDWQRGLQARLVNKAMRTWVSSQNYCRKEFNLVPTVLLINQVRMKMTQYGDPRTTPGGKGQEFATSVEIDMRPGKTEMDETTGKPLTSGFKFRVNKNKTGPANISGEFVLVTSSTETKKAGEILEEEYVVRQADRLGLLEKPSERIYVVDGERCNGMSQVTRHYLLHPELFSGLKEQTMQTLMSV